MPTGIACPELVVNPGHRRMPSVISQVLRQAFPAPVTAAPRLNRSLPTSKSAYGQPVKASALDAVVVPPGVTVRELRVWLEEVQVEATPFKL